MKNAKLSPRTIIGCTQLVLLVFASVVAVMGVVLVKADICDEVEGSCNFVDCKGVCSSKHPGGREACEQDAPGVVTCHCYYECPPPQRNCNAGLGTCSQDCGQQCCDRNCAAKFSNGIGICASLGAGARLCQCQYTC